MLLRGSIFPAYRYMNVCVCGLGSDSGTPSIGFDRCVSESLCLRRGLGSLNLVLSLYVSCLHKFVY
jgi:hypothetical protein